MSASPQITSAGQWQTVMISPGYNADGEDPNYPDDSWVPEVDSTIWVSAADLAAQAESNLTQSVQANAKIFGDYFLGVGYINNQDRAATLLTAQQAVASWLSISANNQGMTPADIAAVTLALNAPLIPTTPGAVDRYGLPVMATGGGVLALDQAMLYYRSPYFTDATQYGIALKYAVAFSDAATIRAADVYAFNTSGQSAGLTMAADGTVTYGNYNPGSLFSFIRDTVETAAAVYANIVAPGSMAITSQLVSQGSQNQLAIAAPVIAIASAATGELNLVNNAAATANAASDAQAIATATGDAGAQSIAINAGTDAVAAANALTTNTALLAATYSGNQTLSEVAGAASLANNAGTIVSSVSQNISALIDPEIVGGTDSTAAAAVITPIAPDPVAAQLVQDVSGSTPIQAPDVTNFDPVQATIDSALEGDYSMPAASPLPDTTLAPVTVAAQIQADQTPLASTLDPYVAPVNIPVPAAAVITPIAPDPVAAQIQAALRDVVAVNNIVTTTQNMLAQPVTNQVTNSQPAGVQNTSTVSTVSKSIFPSSAALFALLCGGALLMEF